MAVVALDLVHCEIQESDRVLESSLLSWIRSIYSARCRQATTAVLIGRAFNGVTNGHRK